MTAAHEVHETKAPVLSLGSAADALRRHFGIDGECSELPSERDRNVRVETDGGAAFVLKVSNCAESPDVVEMEVAAMDHIAGADADLPVPRVVRDSAGAAIVEMTADDGRGHLARVITVVPGRPMEGGRVTLAQATEIGMITGRTSAALAGFFHPAGGRTHVWDIRGVATLAPYAVHIADPENRSLVEGTLNRVTPTLDRVGSLPAQIEHADITLINLLSDGSGRVSGVVDFGDMHHTASVCDIATGLTSVLRSAADRSWDEVRELAAAYLDGYLRVRTLRPEEGHAIADVILARLCVTVLVSAWRAGDHPENRAYIEQYDASSWRLLRSLSARAELTEEFARLCGLSRSLPATTLDPTLRERRDAVVAGSLMPLMYDDPIQLARGEGAWLIDTAGQRHLDGYNNVPVVGHANPVVRQAVSRQLGLLNTNARYLHHLAPELGARLLATMPADLGFDTCILVNSGSEAVDLAWRLATSFTERTGALVGDTAYHGITAATEAFSSNEWPTGHHPGHVETFEAPYAASGRIPGEADATARVEAAVSALAERGQGPALLMADPMFTSAGILDAGTGFMAGLGDSARAAGALVLADEVQSGFGRTGPAMWAFVEGGLRPDIVTVGKPMGNGHPVAAVITRREICEAMAKRYEFFSTFAGSPVSAIAALATLDVLEDRRLPERAVVTGEYLRKQLAALADSVDWISEVRGRGLLAGVQISRSTTDPPVTAKAVAELLRRHRVLIGVTGRRRDVLKIRPPLVWDETHVEELTDALGRVAASITPAQR